MALLLTNRVVSYHQRRTAFRTWLRARYILDTTDDDDDDDDDDDGDEAF